MKNNKIFFLFVSFGLLMGIFSGCQKDSVTLRLRIANFSHDGKVHMEGYTPKWDAGEDFLCVNGVTCTVSNNSVSVTPSIDYKAVYPASIYSSLGSDGVYSLTIPEIQVYKTVAVGSSTYQVVEAPMGGHSNSSSGSTNLWFKNLGALLAITVENQAGHGDLTVDKITVSSNGAPLWGSATLAMPDVTTETGTYNPSYVITEDWNSHQTVILAGNENGGSMGVTIATNASKQFYVYVPAFTPEPSNLFTIQVDVSNASGDGVFRRAQSSAGNGNIPLNQIGSMTFTLTSTYQTTWNENTRPAGALRVGEFTVKAATSSAPAKKVYFSAGNLQYYYATSPSNRKWRIAENQWDYVGGSWTDDATSTTVSYGNVDNGNNYYVPATTPTNKWLDLFGWGTSGYGSGDQAMPWDYANSKTYGNSSNATDANYDWGKYNTIWYGTGSSNAGTWRILTSEEWNYLLTIRKFDNDNNHKGIGWSYSLVTVNDVPGMLIYPDGYSDTRPSTHNSFVGIDAIYPGCAFLPCAGQRGATTPLISALPVQVTRPIGYYWAPHQDYNLIGAYSFPSNADNKKFEYGTQYSLYYGLSVRLVTDVPTGSSSSK